MFSEGWFSDPVAVGWMLFVGAGLLVLLGVASRMNHDPLEGDPHVFHGTEPKPDERDRYGLTAEEVEDLDRRS